MATDKIRIEKDLKGSGGSLIELMSFNLPGRSEDDHEKSQLTNQTPTEYKSRKLQMCL